MVPTYQPICNLKKKKNAVGFRLCILNIIARVDAIIVYYFSY